MAIRHLIEDSIGVRDSIAKAELMIFIVYSSQKRKQSRDCGVNLEETVDSILENAASGDFSTTGDPFQENLRLQTNVDPTDDTVRGGILIVDSGIQFGSSDLQTVPYLKFRKHRSFPTY